MPTSGKRIEVAPDGRATLQDLPEDQSCPVFRYFDWFTIDDLPKVIDKGKQYSRIMGGLLIDRTRSDLMKAQQLENQLNTEMLPSLQMTQAQDASERAFRAILFGMSIKRVRTHRLDDIAREHRAQLDDIWSRLEPLLEEYAWLWDWRNKARHKHIDIGTSSDPPVTSDMIERARSLVRGLIGIAESLI